MKKIMFLLFIVSLAACKPAQVITLHDIEYRNQFVHDTLSTVQHDSIHVEQKGDTVYYETFKTLYRDRTTVKHDSINKYIDKPIPVIQLKKLTWIQSAEIWIGKIILSLVALALLFFAGKYFLKLRKIIP